VYHPGCQDEFPSAWKERPRFVRLRTKALAAKPGWPSGPDFITGRFHRALAL